MKKLLAFISVLMVLGAVVPGCRQAVRYDGRLTAADSLMKGDADSALTLLEDLSPGELHTGRDSAYRDLLLTQARYRAYITATSDSDINRALAWFRAYPADREKLTRAYIYKGAVMDELGHPDSAMLYYKHAEATAAPDDYNNLGQINLRIGSLFRMFYADEQTGFDKYQKALNYYTLTGDKEKQYICLFDMAMFYGILHTDSGNVYIDKAFDLASELRDTLGLCECLELKCRQLSRNDSTLDEAKRLGFECLMNYPNFISYDLLLDLATIYCKQNSIDSANYYLNIVDVQQNPDLERHLAARKHDILMLMTDVDNTDDGNQVSDSLMNDTMKYSIERIENEFSAKDVSNKSRENNLLRSLLAFFIIVGSTILLGLFIAYYRKCKWAKEIMGGLENAGIDRHEQLLEKLNAKDSTIGHFVEKMVNFLQLYAKADKSDSPFYFADRIKESIMDAANDDFWTELRNYIDKRHNGILSHIASFNGIKEHDLNFVALICSGFSYTEIAMIMGYSRKYISNKRNYIAQKMKLNIPLQDYLKKIMDESEPL